MLASKAASALILLSALYFVDAVPLAQRSYLEHEFHSVSNSSEKKILGDSWHPQCYRWGELIPHQQYCHLFYKCENGRLALRQCMADFLFDERKRRCDYADDVTCDLRLLPDDDPEEVNDIIIDPRPNVRCPSAHMKSTHQGKCHWYYRCHDWAANLKQCRSGHMYDPWKRRCEMEDRVSCGSRDRPTVTPPDGGFQCPKKEGNYPHEKDCGKYYDCEKGRYKVKECKKETLFDVNKKKCKDEDDVDCGDRIHPDDDPDEEQDIIVDYKPNYKCRKRHGRFENRDYCDWYYHCKDMRPSVRECRRGLYYDIDKRGCKEYRKVICNKRIRPEDRVRSTYPSTKRTTTSMTEETSKSWWRTTEDIWSKKSSSPGPETTKYKWTGRPESTSRSWWRTTDDAWSKRSTTSKPETTKYKWTGRPESTSRSWWRTSTEQGTIKDSLVTSSDLEISTDSETTYQTKSESPVDETTLRPITPTSGDGSTLQPETPTSGDGSSFQPETSTSVEGSTLQPETPTSGDGSSFQPETSTSVEGSTFQTETPTPNDGTTLQPVDETTVTEETRDVGSSSTTIDQVTSDGSSSTTEKPFVCGENGHYPYQKDCSLYYVCVDRMAILARCPKGSLFDAVAKRCDHANNVDCGDRELPTGRTEVPQESTANPPVQPTTTPEEKTAETTTEPTTTTTTEPTTTPIPTGPPPTNCSKDDLDCIVDQTGDVTVWFTCKLQNGNHLHPSSPKLFIHCINGVPSVRRCATGLEFDPDLLECVIPFDFSDRQ